MIHKGSKAWSTHLHVWDCYPNAPEAPALEDELSKGGIKTEGLREDTAGLKSRERPRRTSSFSWRETTQPRSHQQNSARPGTKTAVWWFLSQKAMLNGAQVSWRGRHPANGHQEPRLGRGPGCQDPWVPDLLLPLTNKPPPSRFTLHSLVSYSIHSYDIRIPTGPQPLLQL